ncbi:hypothetical protein [Nonomuraea cypriaca]|nr:hypothetical protein [Nonomuraea cypriaca]
MQWFRAYWDDEDIWFYLEVDAEGWVARQVELRGSDSMPIAAASLAEWQEAQSAERLGQYEATYGMTAESPVQEWDGYDPQQLRARLADHYAIFNPPPDQRRSVRRSSAGLRGTNSS